MAPPGPAGSAGPGSPGRAGGPGLGSARDFGAGQANDLDPGLAWERTRLAWTRTAIAFVAVGAAVLKSHLVAGLTVLGLAGIVWGLRHLFRDTAVPRSQPARLLGITLTVVAVAVVALVIAFVGHHP